MLCTYGEGGAEGVRASTSKSKIREILVECQSEFPEPELDEAELKKLDEAIAKDEVTTYAGVDLGNTWGGFQLFILELE